MKYHLQQLFMQALIQLPPLSDSHICSKGDKLLLVMTHQGSEDRETVLEFQIERTRDPQHGDFACNVAMILGKLLKQAPQQLAKEIIARLPAENEWVQAIKMAGPGFINIYLKPVAYHRVLETILVDKERYGRHSLGNGKSVLIEFVSANPTGPLHVGHGRGAAYGASLARLLEVAGYQVACEYYINDSGRQMDILALSVWLRYLELCGETLRFPTKVYQGDYVWDIAATLHREHRDAFRHPSDQLFAGLTETEEHNSPDSFIDTLIQRCQTLLGATAYRTVFQLGLTVILEDIRRDLQEFGVHYDQWFPESQLVPAAEALLEKLTQQGLAYQKEGALWFRSSLYDDEKDRVLRRENGQMTYFATDIAYHWEKLQRGFDHVINIWGADHHGYIPRIKAVLAALGADPQRLSVLLVQFATLYRGKERLQMSTRSGEFVTLRSLREEVGNDAARFFYVQRRCEQHLNFDLELAKSHTLDNPIYYIQYGYARTIKVFRRLQEQGGQWEHNLAYLQTLATPQERSLLILLTRYPEVIASAACAYEPHQIAHYLRDLAQQFHSFYEEHRILVEEMPLRNARLSLTAATQQVLYNGLTLIGVTAPEEM